MLWLQGEEDGEHTLWCCRVLLSVLVLLFNGYTKFTFQSYKYVSLMPSVEQRVQHNFEFQILKLHSQEFYKLVPYPLFHIDIFVVALSRISTLTGAPICDLSSQMQTQRRRVGCRHTRCISR